MKSYSELDPIILFINGKKHISSYRKKGGQFNYRNPLLENKEGISYISMMKDEVY